MFANIYKKLVIDFSKITLFLIFILVLFSLYHAKNFNLDASSDALILEVDKDLKYLREVNERYGSKDFLVLTYSPITRFDEDETILNLQLLKSKIEKLSWVDSVITIIDVPLLKSTDDNLMERLKNYKTLAHPEIDKKRGFEEIINSPIYKNYVISEDGKTSAIVVYLKKMRFDDWLHHIIMMFAFPLAMATDPGSLLNHAMFYLTGLPGAINYKLKLTQ